MTGPIGSLEPAAIRFMLECLQESTRRSGCFLLVIYHVIISIGVLESDSLSLSTQVEPNGH